MITASARRHPITIQKPTAGAADSYGATADTWSVVADVWWAEVRTLFGRELERAQQLQADATVQVTILYRSDLTTRHRFVYDGRTFAIEAIVPDMLKSQQICLCREVV
jgi:SPP1 family predicted phage head-tail adaptor